MQGEETNNSVDELELMEMEQEREEMAANEASESTTSGSIKDSNESESESTNDDKTGDLITYTVKHPQERYSKLVQSNVYTKDEYDRSITEPHIYEIQTSPQFIETKALFIGNLTTPFSNRMFKSQLDSLLQASEDFKMERLWISRNRTHAFVLLNSLEAASLLKENLNGKWFPNLQEEEEKEEEGTTRHQLFVEFIPVKALPIWIDQEYRSPRNAVWKVNYFKQKNKKDPKSEEEIMIANHKMLNYPNRTMIDYNSNDISNSIPNSRRIGSGKPIRYNQKYHSNNYSYPYHNPYPYSQQQRGGYGANYNRPYYNNYNSSYYNQGYPPIHKHYKSSYRTNTTPHYRERREERGRSETGQDQPRSRSKSPIRDNKPLSPEWAT